MARQNQSPLMLSRFGPFGEFVVEVHGSLGLRGSPGLAGVSVAKEVLQTLAGVGTICVDTPSVATAPVRPGQAFVLICAEERM